MRTQLKTYMARLATRPDVYAEFVADPAGAAERAGLSAAEVGILLSGEQNRIYAALVESGRAGAKREDSA